MGNKLASLLVLTCTLTPFSQAWALSGDRVLLMSEIMYVAQRPCDTTPFTLKRKGLSLEEEVKYLNACILPQAEKVLKDSRYFPSGALQGEWFHFETGVSGVILSDTQSVFVIYTGSHELDNWTDNFNFIMNIESLKPAHVHRGLYDGAWKPSAARILALLNKYNYKNKQLWLGGHSFGGAMAQLTAYTVAETKRRVRTSKTRSSIKLVTYASPALGNQAFVDRFPKNVEAIRVWSYDDLVPGSLEGISGNIHDKNDVYVQLGTSLKFAKDGTLQVGGTLNRKELWAAMFGKWYVNHRWFTYRDRARKLIVPSENY